MSEDIYKQVAESILVTKEAWKEYPHYYLFEGYDVEPREEDVFKIASDDGIDLLCDYLLKHCGRDPHPFQNGYLLSTKFFRAMMAANQDGKSVTVFMEIQMRMSGEIPFAYRVAKGVDTGIPRLISPENIRRFGRISRSTQKVIDHNEKAHPDGTWNCGNVMGRGVFPSSKLVPYGGTLRLGSYQKIILANWWPAFTGRAKDSLGKFFLPTAIDRDRGSFGQKGANKQDNQIFYKGERTVQLLTYESGPEKFETITPPTYLDEEPPDPAIIHAVITHCTDWSLTETPIFGITYSRDLVFPEIKSTDSEVFHATTFDCPYHTREMIEKQRRALAGTPWVIGARLYGMPTEQKGKPYYDRAKINLWTRRFRIPYKLVTFTPVMDWDGIRTCERRSRLRGLLDVDVRMDEVSKDDRRAVWRLYEDRKDGLAYVLASDQAEGAENPEDVGDLNAGIIGRQRDSIMAPTSPVICAAIESTLPTPQYAREMMYAARYYNNALLAPETGRGAANATFKEVCSGWPWWFRDTIEKWSTRKPMEAVGFCPTTDRREILFDKLLRDWFDSFTDTMYPEIPDERILDQAAAAIVGVTKGKTATRCDHPREGTIDLLFAYGILHFVLQTPFAMQIRCHGGPEASVRKKTWLELAEEASNKKTPELAGIGETMKRLR